MVALSKKFAPRGEPEWFAYQWLRLWGEAERRGLMDSCASGGRMSRVDPAMEDYDNRARGQERAEYAGRLADRIAGPRATDFGRTFDGVMGLFGSDDSLRTMTEVFPDYRAVQRLGALYQKSPEEALGFFGYLDAQMNNGRRPTVY